MPDVRLMLGDCLERLPEVADSSVDAVICDPPYPMIKREYGCMTEADWHVMMHGVVAQCRRILKPTGSAVFVLQPNSRKIGSMRLWLFEFMVWAGREWNLIQDAWWWNIAAMPEAHAIQGRLMRPSVKACVWLGPTDCYRDQDSVLWDQAALSRTRSHCARARNEMRVVAPSGHAVNASHTDASAIRRGGVTPFNLIPTTHGHGGSELVAGSHGHPAGTPRILCNYWIKFISPPGGVVCDPFMGSGTVGLSALAHGRSFIGIEQFPPYFAMAERRMAAARAATPLFDATA